jgi:hypothetical protein
VGYVGTVKTASGACAVQIVHSSRKGSRDIEHIGSAHDDVELELLRTVARQWLAAGQGELDLGLDAPPEVGGPLPITASRMGHLWDALALAAPPVHHQPAPTRPERGRSSRAPVPPPPPGCDQRRSEDIPLDVPRNVRRPQHANHTVHRH